MDLLTKLTKNSHIDKSGYSGHGIGFDRKAFFSHPSGRTGRNVIIFGVDMISSPYIDNKGNTFQFMEKYQHKD